MAISVSEGTGKQMELAPAGTHAAVLADVFDMGLQETAYGDKHKVMLSWLIDKKMSDGRPFMVSDWPTASLNEKARLRKYIEGWRGPLSAADVKTLAADIELVIGEPCLLSVIHKENNKGEMRAYVNGAMALPDGMTAPAIPDDFKRKIERDAERAAEQNGSSVAEIATAAGFEVQPPPSDGDAPPPEDAEELPF